MTPDTPQTPAPAPEVRETPPNESTWIGLGLAWEMGYTIAIPAVIFSLGGAYTDRWLHTSPIFLLLGIVLAFAISFLSIASKIRQITRRLPKYMPKPPDVDAEHHAESEEFHDSFKFKP